MTPELRAAVEAACCATIEADEQQRVHAAELNALKESAERELHETINKRIIQDLLEFATLGGKSNGQH